MQTFTLENGTKISFKDQGEGKPIVLLHGFMESSEIWKPVKRILLEHFRVICIDLPGHGGSEMLKEELSMESMADAVMEVLAHLKIKSCMMAGHSMGGYVALAFAERYPDFLKGLCLFHSTALPDDEEKKKGRTKAMKIVSENKSGFIREIIPNLFAKGNKDKFSREYAQLVAIADAMTPEAIIASLKAMRDRKDRTDVLKKSKCPVLFIAGTHDNIIPWNKLKPLITLPEKSYYLLLSKTGHLGFIETKYITGKTLMIFGIKVFPGIKELKSLRA